MNKLILENGEIVEKNINDNIIISIDDASKFLGVKTLKIKITKDTNLIIKQTSTEKVKFDIYINIEKNVKCNIIEYKENGKYKLGYKYYLEEGANLNVTKINDTEKIKELMIFNLNGKKAKLNYILKTIAKKKEEYDIMVYHNHKETESNIMNHGVNIKEGEIKFNVSAFIPKGIKNCVASQKNQIINLTDSKCEIKPNLFIDENEVAASHSAHIGKCDEEKLFYLRSRGIKKKDAESLLIKGFLLQKLNSHQEEMEKIIKKYWR